MYSFPILENLCQIAFLVFLPLSLANTTSGNHSINCYACGSGENISDCGKFNYSDLNSTKACSSGTQGCSTYYEGEAVINMGCEDYKFNKCLEANFITYCYCTSSLCNRIDLIKNSAAYSSDDEDLAEGSGFPTKITESQNTPTRPTVPPTLPSTKKPRSTGIYVKSNISIFITSIILAFVH